MEDIRAAQYRPADAAVHPTWAGGQRPARVAQLGRDQPATGRAGQADFYFTLAAHISEIREHISEWRGLFVIGLHTLIMMGAVVVPRAILAWRSSIFMIALIMLFAAGLSMKWIAVGAGLGWSAYRSCGILSWWAPDHAHLVLFDPSIDPDISRQATYGKIAIGSGQLSGQGLTNGTMTQMQIVSENQTDYIFSVAGEELGFIGCMLIIGLLTLLILRLFYVSYRASTTFSSLLAVGVSGMFLFQTFMNIFMNVGLLPVMGLTLPFFSYGGTSIVTMYAALGIAAGVRMREKPSWLQAAGRKTKTEKRGKDVRQWKDNRHGSFCVDITGEPFHLRHALTVEAVMRYFMSSRARTRILGRSRSAA